MPKKVTLESPAPIRQYKLMGFEPPSKLMDNISSPSPSPRLTTPPPTTSEASETDSPAYQEIAPGSSTSSNTALNLWIRTPVPCSISMVLFTKKQKCSPLE